MRHGHLDRLGVEALREFQGPPDGLAGLARKADDEIPVDRQAELVGIVGEPQRSLDRSSLLDVPQDLRVSGFVAHDKQPATGVPHRLQRLEVDIYSRGTRPREVQRLEVLAEFQRPVLADVEGVVVKENLPQLREAIECPAHLRGDILGGTGPPPMTGNRLRPKAERTKRGTSAFRVERDIGVFEERHVVPLDVQVPPVDSRDPRQCVEVVDLRNVGIVDDLARRAPETDAPEFAKGLAIREVHDLVIEFLANHEVNRVAGKQALVRPRPDMRSYEADLDTGIGLLHGLRQRAIVHEARGRREQHDELEVARHRGDLRGRDLVRWRVDDLAVFEHASRVAQPDGIPVRFDLARGGPAGTRSAIEVLVRRRVEEERAFRHDLAGAHDRCGVGQTAVSTLSRWIHRPNSNPVRSAGSTPSGAPSRTPSSSVPWRVACISVSLKGLRVRATLGSCVGRHPPIAGASRKRDATSAGAVTDRR